MKRMSNASADVSSQASDPSTKQVKDKLETQQEDDPPHNS